MDKKAKRFNITYILLLILVVVLCVYLGTQKTGDLGKEIDVSEAYQLIQDKKIGQIWNQGTSFRLRLFENSKVENERDFPANADYHFEVSVTLLNKTLEKINDYVAEIELDANGTRIKLESNDVVDY